MCWQSYKLLQISIDNLDFCYTLQGMDTQNTHGGKREGAGRPIKENKPAPVCWRPESAEVREEFFNLGGSQWINQTLRKSVEKKQRKS
jgi:hypothetical protein